MDRGRVESLAKGALLALVYVALARFGLRIHAVHGFATLVWPPTGIALVAILLLGRRFWPSIAAGALIANVLTGAPVVVAAGIAIGNTLEAILGAALLRRVPGFRPSLDRVKDVLGLVGLAAVASCMLSATIGVASLFLGGIVPAGQAGGTWRAWWLGDAIGDLVVAPVLLSIPLRGGRSRLAEQAAVLLLLFATSFWIFELQSGVVALLSPLLIWAAVRFELPGSARRPS
jgi:integral membrane sensor domain MASE1